MKRRIFSEWNGEPFVSIEAVVQGCSVKKVFLEILQNSKETLCQRLWHRCFPVNFVKFLRTPFLHRTPLVAASVSICQIMDLVEVK